MKILVITKDGLALGLAQRLSREGHTVELYSLNKFLKNPGDGFYKSSDNILQSVQECKFIISDVGNQTQLYKKAKTYNKPIIGCSEMTDLMNADAIKEYDVGNRLGISYPKSEIYDDAITSLQPLLLEGTKKHYYIKRNRRVFTCTRPEWLAWAMYNLPVNERVLLQECVFGSDIDIFGWFNGLNWVKPFFYSSPNSSDIGAAAMLAQRKSNRLTENTIEPLQRFLKSIDYKGPVTASLIVNSKEAFVRRFYIGLTAPCIFASLEGIKSMPLGDFLNALAFGTIQDIDVSTDYLVGLEVANVDADMHGAPILGVEKGNLDHIYFHSAYKSDDSYLVHDAFPPIYTAVARGRDLNEASNRVYRTINEVQFPNMKYLTNLPGQLSPTFNNLRSWSII